MMYQDTISEIKRNKEGDFDRLARIHDRFDYLKDKELM